MTPATGAAMHWMRIQRYWDGEYPEVKPTYQPVMCQQCGHAPCEPVCPVFATVHSEDEQINLQVYNRCIGTRYCANNCPYYRAQFQLVRLSYQIPAPMNYYLNPNVTVRRRGCDGKMHLLRAAHPRRRRTRPKPRAARCGMAKWSPACAQACPADAIIFGDLSDPESRVSKAALSQRRFTLLEELGTQPESHLPQGRRQLWRLK